MNTEQADILSEMMRVVTFDEHGYLTATIAVVELATTIEPDANYLQKGRCIYCIVETTPNDLDTMEKMYTLVVRWAKQHHVDILGVAYIRTRLVVGEVLTSYHECWIPIH